MEIDLPRLRRLIDAALSRLGEESGGLSVTIPTDTNFYWEVADKDLWNLAVKPVELTVGSLVDDIDLFLGSGEGEDDIPIYSLIHAAPILRFLAECAAGATANRKRI